MPQLTDSDEHAVQSSLPTELILRILGFLIGIFVEDETRFRTERQSTLGVLARSSRRMQAIVEPLLYQRVTVVSGKEIERLLYAVLLNPLRKGYVRSLDLRWRSERENMNWAETALYFESSFLRYLDLSDQKSLHPSPYGTLTTHLLETVTRRSKRTTPFNPDSREDFIAAKRHGLSETFLHALATRSPAAQATLLLHELHALEEFVVSPDQRRDYWFWAGFPLPPQQAALRQPLSSGLGTQLQTLIVDVNINAPRACICFLLPKLKRLVISTDDTFLERTSRNILSVIEGKSSVEELEILSHRTDAASIVQMLHAPSRLLKLRFAHDTIQGLWNQEDWTLLGAALQAISTLTHLELVDWEDELDITWWIGSLRELKSLTHVSIPIELLVGEFEADPPVISLSQVLPLSVKEFDLRESYYWMTPGVTLALVAFIPQLKVLYNSHDSGVDVTVACQSNGVVLHNRDLPSHQSHIDTIQWRWAWNE